MACSSPHAIKDITIIVEWNGVKVHCINAVVVSEFSANFFLFEYFPLQRLLQTMREIITQTRISRGDFF